MLILWKKKTKIKIKSKRQKYIFFLLLSMVNHVGQAWNNVRLVFVIYASEYTGRFQRADFKGKLSFSDFDFLVGWLLIEKETI